jgi:hypothetical protein
MSKLMRYLSYVGKSLGFAAIAIGLGSQAAYAVQYKAIIGTGDTLPSSPQQIFEVGNFAVDTQQNIVVGLNLRNADTAGIYRILNNGQPQLLGPNREPFSDVSISMGEVAYIDQDFNINWPKPAKYQFKVGKPGALKTLLTTETASYVDNPGLDEGPSDVSIANGKAFFIANQPAQLGQPELRGLLQVKDNQLSVVLKPDDPLFLMGGQPPLTLGGSLAANGIGQRRSTTSVRVSSETVLLSRSIDRGFQVFEQPNGGRFRKIYEGVTGKMVSSRSCGIAASRSNIVICTTEGENSTEFRGVSKLLLRIGATGQLREVKFPKVTPTVRPFSPALSGSSLAFGLQEDAPSNRNAIYLSDNGAMAKRLIGSGDKLDGKVIQNVALAANGQSIGNGFVVFKATFINGTRTLYKATL